MNRPLSNLLRAFPSSPRVQRGWKNHAERFHIAARVYFPFVAIYFIIVFDLLSWSLLKFLHCRRFLYYWLPRDRFARCSRGGGGGECSRRFDLILAWMNHTWCSTFFWKQHNVLQSERYSFHFTLSNRTHPNQHHVTINYSSMPLHHIVLITCISLGEMIATLCSWINFISSICLFEAL